MASLQTLVVACSLSAVLGGVASGAVLHVLRTDQAAPDPVRSAKDDAFTREGSALEKRLEALEGQISTLRRQQVARTQLQKYAEALQDDAGDSAPKANKPMSGVVDGEDPVFEMAVRSVMDRVDWEKDEERRTVRENRQVERARRQTDLLTERLGLDAEQSQAVATALSRQMQRFRALRDADDDSAVSRPVTRQEWRERIGEIRQQTEDALREILSEEQMRKYVEVAEEEGIGARGFGRGRGGTRDERATGTDSPAPTASAP